MARNRQSKQHHTTRKERNVSKIAKHMAGNLTNDKEFSERLSRVLHNSAINEHVLEFRRKRMFFYEREHTLINKVYLRDRRLYIFGSQIEGTSTMGMMSDTDHLYRMCMFRLFLDSENPPTLQPLDRQIVIKVSTKGCASQYCFLTMIEPTKQARHCQQIDACRYPDDICDFFRRDWRQSFGMIQHTSIFTLGKDQPPEILMRATRHGPAESIWNMDMVNACYCKSLPKHCKYVFERPRPGHWPTEKTLKKAKTYGVFIVPQGPPKSSNICTLDFFDYKWRISTNLTERLLMFSLDTVQLKAYVLTKMIRHELFVPKYRDRLSTFHFKTAFFFAVENTRPDVWREDNLINCVKYILATLRRFLTRRKCPHFTIDNVNLFDGKIERCEFPKLVDQLTDLINSLRKKIENIQMDSFGRSLNEHDASKPENSTYYINSAAILQYVMKSYHGDVCILNAFSSPCTSVNNRIDEFQKKCTLLEMYNSAPLEKYRKYDYVLHGLMSDVASLGASVYLEQKADGREYNHDGINKVRHMFIKSLESNIIGNYMRYASFLLCNGEYDEACTYFDLIEKQIEEDKKSNLIYQLYVSQSELLALQIAKQPCEQSFKQRLCVCLIFRPYEAMCVPEFLRSEMYRGHYGDNTSSGMLLSFYCKEDCICVQIEPYLYYLQYLTYKELQQEPKRSEALMKLSIFTGIINPASLLSSKGDIFFISHFDTSLNMLGHCFELEQKLKSAWKTYTTSFKMQPKKNAAILHIIRLLWPVVQSELRSRDKAKV